MTLDELIAELEKARERIGGFRNVEIIRVHEYKDDKEFQIKRVSVPYHKAVAKITVSKTE
jgi:hypothetical protein